MSDELLIWELSESGLSKVELKKPKKSLLNTLRGKVWLLCEYETFLVVCMYIRTYRNTSNIIPVNGYITDNKGIHTKQNSIKTTTQNQVLQRKQFLLQTRLYHVRFSILVVLDSFQVGNNLRQVDQSINFSESLFNSWSYISWSHIRFSGIDMRPKLQLH